MVTGHAAGEPVGVLEVTLPAPILYPHADDVLGAPASTELKAFIRSGHMPDGWVCTST